MAMAFGCLDYAAWGQNQPYSMTKRVRNVSLFLELEQGVPPATILTSGLFSDIAAQTPAPGLIPYSVYAELWSDVAYKTRFLALPGEADIEFSRDEFWHFPPMRCWSGISISNSPKAIQPVAKSSRRVS